MLELWILFPWPNSFGGERKDLIKVVVVNSQGKKIQNMR
jgi:hypothetical protein